MEANKNMKTVIKLIGEIAGSGGFLFGLYKSGLVSPGEAIMSGFTLLVLVLVIVDFREEMRSELRPIKNALAEIQKFLMGRFRFEPLHEVKPDGHHQSSG